MNSQSALLYKKHLRMCAVCIALAGASALSDANRATGQATTPTPVAPTLQLPKLDTAGRSELILRHLNQVITWYRSVGTQLPTVALPTDSIYQSNARGLALQVVQAAFVSANADALLVGRTVAAQTDAEATDSGSDNGTADASKAAPQIDAQIAQVRAQVEALTAQLAGASGPRQQALVAERSRLQGNLELLDAEDAAVDQLLKFSANGGAPGSTNLQRSIAQLQRNVPEATPVVNVQTTKAGGAATSSLVGSSSPAGLNVQAAATQTAAAAAGAAQAAAQGSGGLISEAGALFSQANSLHRIDVLARQAYETEELAKQLRAPLLAQIKQTLNVAAQWAAAPQAPGAEAGAEPTKKQFDAVTAQFKQLSQSALPLSQEIIDLDQSRSNLTQWRQSLAQENRTLMRKVLTRVGTIALSLGILSLLSVLSGRLIFRYVQDIRRRRQILIMRRFIVGFLMGIVIILGFVSEFSSLATFAGFITAGLAVGLQTILLSVAAYFFLIGRYGIRVGDRISISGITGDVIDVGLIRLYLMELAGTGNDLFPTGRIVVFPNSVLFQATVPLFKQIPGTEYAWHEVAATLTSGANAQLVHEQLLAAVNSVHEMYRPEFEKQHAASSRFLDVHIEVPTPIAQLQFAATGLELVVRYPVGLGNVSKADEGVTQQILAAISASEGLKNSIVGMPQIRVAVKG